MKSAPTQQFDRKMWKKGSARRNRDKVVPSAPKDTYNMSATLEKTKDKMSHPNVGHVLEGQGAACTAHGSAPPATATAASAAYAAAPTGRGVARKVQREGSGEEGVRLGQSLSYMRRKQNKIEKKYKYKHENKNAKISPRT